MADREEEVRPAVRDRVEVAREVQRVVVPAAGRGWGVGARSGPSASSGEGRGARGGPTRGGGGGHGQRARVVDDIDPEDGADPPPALRADPAGGMTRSSHASGGAGVPPARRSSPWRRRRPRRPRSRGRGSRSGSRRRGCSPSAGCRASRCTRRSRRSTAGRARSAVRAAGGGAAAAAGGGVRSHCRVVLPLTHCIPDSVALFSVALLF
jgi:hypothetical protein